MFLRLKSNHGTASFSYGQGGQLLSEVALNTANQALSRKNIIWLGAMPLAQVSEVLAADGSVASTEFVYLHADHLNTPRVATDATGKIVWSWNSDAFGVGSANEDVDGDGALVVVNLRFPGQYFDVESGLHYNYFRDYDPSTGRYVQSDPIGLGGGINTYGYVGGNPLTNYDPDGLFGRTATNSSRALSSLLGGGAANSSATGYDFIGSEYSGASGSSSSDRSSSDGASGEQCDNDPGNDCDRLKQKVREAKDNMGRNYTKGTAVCRPGMDSYDLEKRARDWLRLAQARAHRDQKCYDGGDSDHQNEQAAAWRQVSKCQGLMR